MNSIPQIDQWKDAVFDSIAIEADVLRLDLLHPIISGNKWLKLKSYLETAIDSKKSGILTKGGPWSNHIHACAYACKEFGLNCHLWIKGNEKQITPTLKDCIDWGTQIKFINRTAFYDELSSRKFANENNLLYIPMGGADEIGINSVITYISQLSLPSYTHVICAIGTATTFAGFAFTENNFPFIIGIECGTKDKQLNEKINDWQQQLPNKKLQLLPQYAFGGLSKYNDDLIAFMNDLYKHRHFSTDFIYTAKLFYAIKDMAAQLFFPAKSKLLIIHSGGLQGNRSLPAGLLQF